MLLGHRRECGVEFGGTSGLQELKLHSQPSGGHLQVSYRQRVGRIGRFDRIATRRTLGTVSLSNSSLLPKVSTPTLYDNP